MILLLALARRAGRATNRFTSGCFSSPTVETPIMSSLRMLTGEFSERLPLVNPEQRDKMEAGIDLHTAAMVEEVSIEPPPSFNPPADGDDESLEVVEPVAGHPGADAHRLAAPDKELEPVAPIAPPTIEGAPVEMIAGEPPPLTIELLPATASDAAAAAAVAADEGFVAECWAWIRGNLHWYAISTGVHIVVFVALLLVLGRFAPEREIDSITFQPVDDDLSMNRRLETFEMPSGAPVEPTVLNRDALLNPQIRPVKAENNDKSDTFVKDGGGRSIDSAADPYGGNGGFTIKAEGPGPRVAGGGGIGAEHGNSSHMGSGGAGEGFGGRGKGNRAAMLRLGGGGRDTEVAVAAALNWFFRHRNSNGSWSLSRFAAHCSGAPCSAPGTADSDTAATALAVLPFLGAGETQKSKGPYQDTVKQALYFLMRRQAANGDLSAGTGNQMYAHALGTLALCEAYGMTKEPKVGEAAQRAIFFIDAAQNRITGGWRYVPGDPTGGDTSVLGWQMMALRSAQLAGLSVNTLTMENAKKWLHAVEKGSQHGLFAYQPYKEATPTMTAIGMLSWQYLGMRQDDPAMVEGKHYLLQHLPDNGERSTYYWYYGTQTMHNLTGHDWDVWNRKMRKALVETQCREGCAVGSWDPESPTLDAWSEQGGRIVTTAFSTLSLEVYYRYLPLYNLHSSASDPPPPAILPAE